MPTAEEMFDRWKRIAKDTLPRPWTQENLAGFFQLFRPDGEGLDAVFKDVVGAGEILPRLLEVYRATAEGWDQDGEDAYFIVRHPEPISTAQASMLARSHLDQLAAIAQEMNDVEAVELLLRPLSLVVVEGETPWPPDDDDPETLIYEMRGDFMASLEPLESHALLMKEGLYYIACDYRLQHHILWPLYRHATSIKEPFEPYFRLWKHGIGLRFAGEVVNVYVPVGKLLR